MTSRPGHEAEIDPVTGHETTGHEWNGIRELNTPFPRIVLWALILTFGYSVVSWILLPSWPLGQDFTRGVLGLEQEQVAVAGYRRLAESRAEWMAPFASGDFAALGSDTALMAQAMPAAARLFADNCAACHGTDGAGGPGFPNLRDDDWLWGGDPASIAETLLYGINSPHPDTRFSEMPAFGRLGMLPRADIAAVGEYVSTLRSGADPASRGAALFTDNCAACHGEGGVGGLAVGAPSLTGASWLHGDSHDAILTTVWSGRRGVMPAWNGRLNNAEINMLALYVARLGQGGAAGARR
ncbi:MAG: cytochrome-c oxidase, cbb3-type subunit III [Sneathiellaceae bacterium]